VIIRHAGYRKKILAGDDLFAPFTHSCIQERHNYERHNNEHEYDLEYDMAATAIGIIPMSASGAKNELIGWSQGLREIWDAVQLVARTDAAVLIQGETGTGKELVAKAIHEESLRRRGPYVKVNCAAMPGGLLESELFGHERGAFTGALTQTTGRFQLAHTGTLFLDEIGDLPLELQPKLLRVLQEQEFERLGSARTIRVDVRIVAATNQDLEQMVRERRFRADLFYRLNVFPIALPALRERREDIPLLVQHFVRKFAGRMNREVSYISEEVMAILRHHDWPGNIRELQNCIERAVVLSPGSNLQLPFGQPKSMQFKTMPKSDAPSPNRTFADAERERILQTLRQTGGVVGGLNGAAAKLGLARTTLLYKMRKLGITQEKVSAVGAAAAWIPEDASVREMPARQPIPQGAPS
jgi:formate hydrogenlyase transcriptional activator